MFFLFSIRKVREEHVSILLYFITQPALLQPLHATNVLGSIGQQGHLSRLFNGPAQQALMLGARPGLATGLNFAAIRDVAFHEATSILVVDFANMIVAELANFAARCTLASTALAPFAAWGRRFTTSLHELSPSMY
jgi:hypothetical protein